MELRNKFIFAPVKTGYGNKNGDILQRHLDFYDKRSRYVGAVTPEPLFLDKSLRELPTQIGIDSDDKIEGLKKLTQIIHQNGAKAIAHLNHPGRMANPKIPGNYFVSSTDKPCENGGAAPQKITREGMQEVINLFVNSAIRAEKANFDFLELQFGHGYLMAQFISPFVNEMDYEYNGSFENRIKFPLEVLEAVKAVSNLEIIIRLSGDEIIPNGIKLEDSIKLSKILAEKGVSAIHVSAGTICSTPPWYFQHMFVPKGKTWEFAKAIKNEIPIPVIFVGQINTFEDADKLINDYKADYLALGRPLVADENFVGKYLGEIDDILRPCLSCSDGCLGGVRSGNGLGCLVNPTVGRSDIELQPAKTKKSFAVLGCGLAGMSAALTLKQRGYDVTIFEKDDPGGQFNLASLPPKKQSMEKLVDYYVAEIKKNNIEVIFEEVAIDEIKQKFDVAVIATGSKLALPPIPGLKDYYWAEILNNENLPENKNVVIIGGGLIGIEIAHKLEQNSNNVYIVEMLDELARGMEMIEKTLILKSFKNEHVNIFLNTKVTKIEGSKVFIEGSKFKKILDNIDIIVIATGMKSYNPLEKDLEGMEYYVIGDAKKVGKAHDAIRDGFDFACTV